VTLSVSYEEMRAAAIDAILALEAQALGHGGSRQWNSLNTQVARQLYKDLNISEGYGMSHTPMRLNRDDSELLREVFWELFRQGIITLGIDENNAGWPFFSLSRFGRKILEGDQPYRFTNAASYMETVRRFIPRLDDLTATYLDEAFQSFHSGCLLAANVMLGVAAECRFDIMLEAIAATGKESTRFAPALKEKMALGRIKAFRNAVAPLLGSFPRAIGEDLSTRLDGIQSVIRIARNEAGHPSGVIPDRDSTFVNLRLFITFGQKLDQLQDHLTQL
jgi:hypothetical protein